MERSDFLQLMRFVAAGLVLAAHVTFYYHERVDQSVPVWGPGGVGVPIFFVISGIVMVAASGNLPPGFEGARAFFLRRVIRIVPLWWLALLIKVSVALAWPQSVNHNHFQLDHAVKSFLFVPYFTGDRAVVPLHGVGWTLLHEMFFYLLFGLALWLRLRPLWWVSGAIALAFLLGHVMDLDAAWWSVATNPVNFQFVLGMLLATVLMKSKQFQQQRHLIAGALLAAAVLLWFIPEPRQVHFVVPVLLAFAASVLLLTHAKVPSSLRWMVRLGDSSYSLYLFHPFIAPALVLILAKLAPGLAPGVHLTAVFIATTLLAHAIHLIAEVPIVQFARNRLPMRRHPAPLG